MISETQKQKLLLLDLLEKLLKSWWTLVAGVCVGASLAVVALHFTIPVYEAEATIEADVEQLPAEFVRRTVSNDVEIQLRELKRAVLSDENLKAVINTVFGTPNSQSHEQAVANRIRSNVWLRFTGRTQTISVLYRSQVPRTAARVTDMLAELFVEENKKLRAARAGRVLESIETLAADIGPELEEKNRALSEFLVKHSHELESLRPDNERAIERLQGELAENEKAVGAAKGRARILETQSARDRGYGVLDAPAVGEGLEIAGRDARIMQIEQEIENLLINFTENHPDVVAKRRELERLWAAIEDGRGGEKESPEAVEDPAETPAGIPKINPWNTRLRAAKLEIDRLESRGQGIRRDLARYRSYIANTPMIQQQVDEFTSRVQVLEQMQQEQEKKIEAARAGQRLEQEDIANPFVVTRYAAIPAVPVWPSRPSFLLAGIAGGLLLFTGPVVAKAFLRPTILSEARLSLLADVPVLVTIPVIPTPGVARLRRQAILRNLGLSALAAAMAAGVAAMQYIGLI